MLDKCKNDEENIRQKSERIKNDIQSKGKVPKYPFYLLNSESFHGIIHPFEQLTMETLRTLLKNLRTR